MSDIRPRYKWKRYCYSYRS